MIKKRGRISYSPYHCANVLSIIKSHTACYQLHILLYIIWSSIPRLIIGITTSSALLNMFAHGIIYTRILSFFFTMYSRYRGLQVGWGTAASIVDLIPIAHATLGLLYSTTSVFSTFLPKPLSSVNLQTSVPVQIHICLNSVTLSQMYSRAEVCLPEMGSGMAADWREGG